MPAEEKAPTATPGFASMTGFGEAHAEADGDRIAIEVRSINNRHLKLNFRAGDGYGVLEQQVEAAVRRHVHRGAVHVGLRIIRTTPAGDYRISPDTLRSYQEQLEALRHGAAPPIEALLSLPGVIVDATDDSVDPRDRWPAIEPVLLEALASLRAMRLGEGRALAADLLENCERIAEELAGVESRAPHVAEAYRSRLAERVNKSLAELGVSVEPADLVREVALFADRSDISEETVRLRSHLDQFRSAIERAEGGRKLEFIAQEMGRETNTIGSKASDAEVSQRVVAIKTALERIREQVQNVE